MAANIEISHDHSSWQLKILGEGNDPVKLKKFEQALKETVLAKGQLQITDRTSYNRAHADVGYRKSAYLALFAKLGYTYIRHISLDPVRKQIQSPHERLLDTVRIYTSTTLANKSIYWFNSPVQCLGVKYGDSVVALPMPGSSNDLYGEIHALKSSGAVTWKGDGQTAWPN